MSHIKRTVIFILTLILITLSAAPIISAAPDDKIVIVLDPGHGGKDPGAVSGIRYESYYNLQVALAAKAKLEANGNFIVYMTRSNDDTNPTLAERLYYAYTVDADAVISIHFNSGGATSIGGVEVYGSVLDRFYLGELGHKISAKVSAAAGINNRGVFRKKDYGTVPYYWSEEYQWDIQGESELGVLSDYYGVITWGAKFGIPSLIVEHAYLSNESDRQIIDNDAVLKKMGEADAEALIEYYTNHTHRYGEETVDAPVTCFSAGKKSVHCAVCGHRKNVTSVAASPDNSKHLWVVDGKETPATCEADGYAKYYCRYTHNLNDKGCEQFEVHYKEEVTPAYGHDYEITLHQEVTHTVDGITTYCCSRCNNTYSDIVAAEGHTFTLTDHAEPDCVTDGHDTYTCDVCGENSVDVIPMLGHDFNIITHTDPTCEEEGSDHRICKVCKFEEEATIPPTGHDYILYSDILPNCTEEGIRETKCTVCGKMETIISEKTSHSFAVIDKTEARCEAKGELLRQCVVCGFEETVILDALEHDWDILSEIKAGCTEDGSISKKCRNCGKEATDTVPASGHDFDDGTVLKEAGLLFKGSIEYKCKSDGSHTEVKPIPRLTFKEYLDQSLAEFIVICIIFAVLIIGAAVVTIMILKTKKRPALSSDSIADTAETEERSEPDESPASDEETKVKEPIDS